MDTFINDVARHADLLGFILFVVLVIYFAMLPDKTLVEKVLLATVSLAALIDAAFVYALYTKN
jgi:hypothetical protein